MTTMWKTKRKLQTSKQNLFSFFNIFFVILVPNQTLKVQGRRLIILQFSVSVCSLFIKIRIGRLCLYTSWRWGYLFLWFVGFEEIKTLCPFYLDISACFKRTLASLTIVYHSLISTCLSIITSVIFIVFTSQFDQVSPCNQISNCTCLLFWRPGLSMSQMLHAMP